MRTLTRPWPSPLRIRLSIASSRFRVDGTGGTIGPPPHFLVRTRSLQSWLRLPSRVSETKKRSVSLSHSQVSVLETLLSSVCEVMSWLDWWLSTYGGFCEHLSGEVRVNFKRLMLSGSRALEFLGGQGVAALGNLVLSRQFAPTGRSLHGPGGRGRTFTSCILPSTASLFPPPLLETALTKMHAASNDTLVQKTLHPPRIPKKSVLVQGKASSSASSAVDRGGKTPVVPRSQQSSQSTSSSSSSSRGRPTKNRKGETPFSQATGHSGGKQKGSG